VTLIVDGKAISLRCFDSTVALVRYEEPLVLQDDMTGHVFCWQVGDCIILDSAKLPHGTRDYLGDSTKRMLGLLIIHKTNNYQIP
jgi:hypothetical protein